MSDFHDGKVLFQDWHRPPVAFVSVSFKDFTSLWFTAGHEYYAVLTSFTRLAHICAACSVFLLITDHKHITYMLSPFKFNSNVACDVAQKTHRWALQLARLNYVVEPVFGDCNIWAEMLTQWAAPGNSAFPARKISSLIVPLPTKDLPDLPFSSLIPAA